MTLETDTLAKLRARINSGGGYEACATDVVGAFDTFAGQYAKQLLQRVPLRSARKARLESMRFHNLQTTASEFKAAFDIDILEGMKPNDVAFATLMFHRRHVYEHNGGEVDEKYLKDSGDTSVRLKQAIRESQASAHRLTGLVAKMAKNLHHGFHDIFKPQSKPIERYAERRRMQDQHRSAQVEDADAQVLPRRNGLPELPVLCPWRSARSSRSRFCPAINSCRSARNPAFSSAIVCAAASAHCAWRACRPILPEPGGPAS